MPCRVRVRVEVLRALPGRHERTALVLEEGATVRDALRASGYALDEAAGIFGRRVPLDTVLADGDRVEVYRPLAMDPKQARRRRALSRRR